MILEGSLRSRYPHQLLDKQQQLITGAVDQIIIQSGQKASEAISSIMAKLQMSKHLFLKRDFLPFDLDLIFPIRIPFHLQQC